MNTAAAMLLIVAGVAYPLFALLRLNRVLGDPGRPPSALYLAAQLLLTAALPLGAILGGVGLLLPRLWAGGLFSVLVVSCAVLAAGAWLVSFMAGRRSI